MSIKKMIGLYLLLTFILLVLDELFVWVVYKYVGN